MYQLSTLRGPRAQAAREGKEEAREGKEDGKQKGGVHLLLIEDQPDVARAYRVILTSRGYKVHHVSSAGAALDESLDDIDVIISDIGLPDMDGRVLLPRLHARKHIPAIALSGYGTEQDIQESLDAGFTAHLTKPTEMRNLLAAIATAIAASRP